MSGDRRSVGMRGEEAAKVFLQRRGYTILEENYRTPLGEIDVIARDGATVVFVEVKTRRSALFGPPQEAVTAAKRHQIVKVAEYYLARRGSPAADYRFDVVAVSLSREDEPPQCTLIPDAFSVDEAGAPGRR